MAKPRVDAITDVRQGDFRYRFNIRVSSGKTNGGAMCDNEVKITIL